MLEKPQSYIFAKAVSAFVVRDVVYGSLDCLEHDSFHLVLQEIPFLLIFTPPTVGVQI